MSNQHVNPSEEVMEKSILQLVREVSESVNDGRNLDAVMCSIAEETGELAAEVNIVSGRKPHKVAGVDGILGEAVDVIITALDMIYVESSNRLIPITEEEITDVVKNKLFKLQVKSFEHSKAPRFLHGLKKKKKKKTKISRLKRASKASPNVSFRGGLAPSWS